MTATVAGIHLGLDTHANRPAANTAPAGSIYSCSTHSKIYKTDGASTWSDYATLGAAASGSITASGYTQSTARLLGRTTGSSGAIEEITVGSGLSLSAGALTASGGGSVVPNLILDYTLAADINGVALTANTWIDILANQNFTVANASSLIEIAIRGYAFNNVAVGQCGSRIVIDSAGTPINEQLHSTNFNANGVGNIFATGPVFKSGLSAAVHTIKLQAHTPNGTPGAIYCRASSNPPLEFLRIQIIEHLPA
jgi:hypothetical protein